MCRAAQEEQQSTDTSTVAIGTGRAVVGGVGFAVAVLYVVAAALLPMGSASQPGPGVFPLVVGVAFALVCAGAVVEALARPAFRERLTLSAGVARRRLLVVTVTLLASIVATPYLGIFVAATALMLVSLRVLGNVGWVRSVVYGLVTSAVLYAVFVILLRVPLPNGIFD